MDEILYELRDCGCALNAGRWDYIFSAIKKFRARDWVLPDRVAADDDRAVHARVHGAARRRPATGAARTRSAAWRRSSRRASDPEVNEVALAKVREDKERESGDGFDGTWVAHPDLVPVATEVFDARARRAAEPARAAARGRRRRRGGAARPSRITPGEVTEAGVRTNVSVGVRYLDSWLRGVGAAAIDNLMEDAATAEISRSQLWQWVAPRPRRRDSRCATRSPRSRPATRRRQLFASLALADQLEDFLTLPAYERLD